MPKRVEPMTAAERRCALESVYSSLLNRAHRVALGEKPTEAYPLLQGCLAIEQIFALMDKDKGGE